MEPKYSKIFNKSVESYCKLNNIEDVDGFIKKCFDTGFNIEKYGLLGKTLNDGEKEVIKEVIVEVVKEIPIETIKEVEIIKEVIVEKEIPIDRIVEKEIYITDNQQVNELLGKVVQLEESILQLNQELNNEKQKFTTETEKVVNFYQSEMSKKDEELDQVRRNLDVSLDKSNEKLLQDTLQKLRKDLTEKNEKIKELIKINNDLENISKTGKSAVFLRGSNLNDTI